MSSAAEILKRHEEETGRCFTMACRWNKPDGCDKPLDSPCPQFWFLTGVKEAGKGVDMARKWKK